MATEAQLREFVGVLLSRIKTESDSYWSRIPTERIQALIRDPSLLVMLVLDCIGKEAMSIIGEPKSFSIDRSNPFNPAKFIGTGWTIWKGPKDGNGLEGEEEQDARSLAITEVKLSQFCFEHCLKAEEQRITGEQKIARLKEDCSHLIRPDAGMAQGLFEEPGRRTLEWIRENLGKTWFDFPGTELRSPGGHRYILYLYVRGAQWNWSYRHLDDAWCVDDP
ncbi:MAG: hypothetical protein Q8O19_04905, partial [Rectinemataceae bacterium]|nr:hypothetical protein [Rectinemataceae bacterium]